MKYKQELYARELYRDLKAQFYGDQNTMSKIAGLFKKNNPDSGIKVLIEGRGVHWKCIVEHGNTQCHIHCFDYDFVKSEIKGPEYYTHFKLDDVVIATGRTQDRQSTVEAVAYWCNKAALEFLYEHFEFIDRHKRALERIKADVISFYPDLLNADKIGIVDDHFYTFHLQVAHNARSCKIYCSGYKSVPVYKFEWDDTFIFETSIQDTARIGLLIKQWVIDAEKPSVLAGIFTEIDFGELAEFYEKGNPMEGEFLKSWNSVEAFYKNVNLTIQPEIMKMINTMREKGFDKTLRAGTSLFSLILSRSRRHGLRHDQPDVSFSFEYIKSIMEVRTWEREVLTFDSIKYTDSIERILKALEQQPID